MQLNRSRGTPISSANPMTLKMRCCWWKQRLLMRETMFPFRLMSLWTTHAPPCPMPHAPCPQHIRDSLYVRPAFLIPKPASFVCAELLSGRCWEDAR